MQIDAKAIQHQEKNHGEHERSDEGVDYPSFSFQARTGLVSIVKGDKGKDQKGEVHQP